MRKMTKMTPLRRRMIDAMLLRGFAPRTQEAYCDAVIALAKHYDRSPDTLSAEQLQSYLLFLITEKKLAYARRKSPWGTRASIRLRVRFASYSARCCAGPRFASTFPWPKCPNACRKFSRARKSRA